MMTASDILIRQLKRFEGLRLKAYQDAKGIWTIGYGHTGDVQRGDCISREEAEALLKKDLVVFEDYVNSLGVCEDNQGRFEALVDFAYNCGIENLRNSQLLECIKGNCSEEEIRAQFLRWIYSGKKKLKGLERRRRWEADRFYNKQRASILDVIRDWIHTM